MMAATPGGVNGACARVPTVWTPGAAHVVEYAVSRGADRAGLLAAIGIDATVLADPDRRLPVTAYYAAVEAAADALRAPWFGLDYIDAVEPSALGAIGFLAAASRTLGEAIGRIVRYHPTMTEAERFELDVVRGRACFRFTPWGPPRPAHAQVTDMYAADCLLLAARMTGAPIEILTFRVTHAPRDDGAEHRRRFGRAPDYGAPANEWSVPAEVLDRPLLRADPGLLRFFERYLSERAARPGAGPAPGARVADEVRRIVCERLVDRDIDLDATAAWLRMSPRTLQRRLAAAGTSLGAILDEVRRSRATAYLDMGLPAAEVSWLLGFSEPAAFFRAFRRWTGTTPRAWRRAG